MYNYGSEAWKEEHTAFRGEEVVVSRENRREAQMAQRIEQLKKKALKTLGIIAAILAVMMVREAQISKLCGEISKQETQIKKLDAMIAERELYLTGQLDLDTVEEIAQTRLGMHKPVQDECVYITINAEDGGEILMEENSSDSGFSAFIDKAKILLEYLY